MFIDAGSASYLNGLSEFTLSCWFKLDTAANNNTIISDWMYNTIGGKFALQTTDSSGSDFALLIFIRNSVSDAGNNIAKTDRIFTQGNWYNLVFSFNSSSCQFYINGSPVTTTITGTIPTSLLNQNGNLNIGKFGGTLTRYFDGQISNVAIWNSDQSSEISNIYNSGVPATTYTNTPTAWYKLDQSANWEADSSGAWQIPDAVSAYPQSFDFDATSDIINFSTIDLGTTHTISMWVKITATSFANIISGTGGSAIRLNAPNRIYYYTNNYTNTQPSVSTPLNQWNNIVIVRETTTVKFYVNNSLLFTTPPSEPFNGDNFTFNKILGLDVNNQTSNIQLWDTALPATGTDSVETLYNNGTPLTTAIASDNLKAWYKLDNTATFSTNWSVPDASGNGNTGTSSGMTEQNLVNNNVSALNGESSFQV